MEGSGGSENNEEEGDEEEEEENKEEKKFPHSSTRNSSKICTLRIHMSSLSLLKKRQAKTAKTEGGRQLKRRERNTTPSCHRTAADLVLVSDLDVLHDEGKEEAGRQREIDRQTDRARQTDKESAGNHPGCTREG